MKLRNKLAAITAAAMLAFTGVGFAAWIFENEATVAPSATNEITTAVELTGLTNTTGAFKLVLDQPVKSYNAQGKDVHWEDNNGNVITSITLTPAITVVDGSDNPTIEYAITSTVDGGDIENYVSFTPAADPTGTFTKANYNSVTITYTLPTVAYILEPSSLANYNTMVAALDGETVDFSITLNITDNVA